MELLWNLVRRRVATDRPLGIGGVYPRHVGPNAKQHLVAKLEASVRRLDAGLVGTETYRASRQLLEGMLAQEFAHRVCALDREVCFDLLWELIRQTESDDGPDAAFWRQELWSLDGATRHAWGLEQRDRAMGAMLAGTPITGSTLAGRRFPARVSTRAPGRVELAHIAAASS